MDLIFPDLSILVNILFSQEGDTVVMIGIKMNFSFFAILLADIGVDLNIKNKVTWQPPDCSIESILNKWNTGRSDCNGVCNELWEFLGVGRVDEAWSLVQHSRRSVTWSQSFFRHCFIPHLFVLFLIERDDWFEVGGKVDGVEGRKLHGLLFDVSGSKKRLQWTREGHNLFCNSNNTFENNNNTGTEHCIDAWHRKSQQHSCLACVGCCQRHSKQRIWIIIIFLLELSLLNLNFTVFMQNGSTALMLACDKGREDVAKLLLAAGADALCTNNVCEWFSLWFLCWRLSSHCVQL